MPSPPRQSRASDADQSRRDATASVRDGATDLVDTARDLVAELGDLPRPGRGATACRWQALADVAARDLSLARLVEGHVDAQAVLEELGGPTPRPSGLLGVWAARPGELRATARGGGWVLDGTKPFCSGATALDQALVTASTDVGVRLFLVDGDAPSPSPGSWRPLGMEATRSETLRFDGVTVDAGAVVGGPGAYVARPGFGHGGCGVAACWWGGARSLLDDVRDRLRSGGSELQLARFAAVAVAVDGAAEALRTAAVRIDRAPADIDVATLCAARTRLVAATAGREVVAAATAVLGTDVLGADPVTVGRMADLITYLTQFHDESAVDLGARLLHEDPVDLC